MRRVDDRREQPERIAGIEREQRWLTIAAGQYRLDFGIFFSSVKRNPLYGIRI